MLLTDNNYTILNVLRPRTDKETDMRFSVQEQLLFSPYLL